MTWWTLVIGALVCAGVPALVFLRNLPHFRPPRPSRDRVLPGVSVLVPARNEARTIASALRSVLAERELDLEVVVLDDGSSDGTAQIVLEFAGRDPRVRLATAPPLPPGWCGKQHACWVLAGLARHDVLVFMDADVRLEQGGLRRAVGFLRDSGAQLTSGFPRQVTRTALERALLPLIHFVLLGFLPMWRMRRSRHTAYGAGCGQLVVVERGAYEATGGHAAIRSSLHDGLALPRAFRAAGFRTDLFDGTAIAHCRMYRSARDVWAGLGKNAHEGLAASSTALLGTTLFLLWGQVLPLPLLVAALLLDAPTSIVATGALAALLGPAVRAIASRRFLQPKEGALTHPLAIVLLLLIQWQAFARHRRGAPVSWRSRSYVTAVREAASRG